MSYRDKLKQLFRSLGLEVARFSPVGSPLARRMQLLRRFEVNVVLDVGGNRGQFGKELRQYGYRGRIISFEPLPDAFAALRNVAALDGNWQAVPVGLGAADGDGVLHVAANSVSSSVLPMQDLHLRIAPHSRFVREETIALRRLDSVWKEISIGSQRPYLKIDVQGYESSVLEGARGVMHEIVGLQLEMSTASLYEGDSKPHELMEIIWRAGFELMSLEPGLVDHSVGRLLQFDAVFYRPNPPA